jgi:hypothetical protein
MNKEKFNEVEHEEWLYHLGANGIKGESFERLLDELFPVEVGLQALRELHELKEKT